MGEKETRSEYYSRTTKQYRIQFSRKKDADVIEKLDSVPVKIDYLRKLIREDLGQPKKE